MQTIVYQVKDAVYANLTNRCPCACTFCLRAKAPGVYGSPSLWLEREPTAREVLDALAAADPTGAREVVFCGYGEPTERLDVLLKVAADLKARNAARRVRAATKGRQDDELTRRREFVPLVPTEIGGRFLSFCRPRLHFHRHFLRPVLEFAPSPCPPRSDIP